jgi:hypothetical protein
LEHARLYKCDSQITPTDTKNSFHLDSFTAICVIRGNFSELQWQRWAGGSAPLRLDYI